MRQTLNIHFTAPYFFRTKIHQIPLESACKMQINKGTSPHCILITVTPLIDIQFFISLSLLHLYGIFENFPFILREFFTQILYRFVFSKTLIKSKEERKFCRIKLPVYKLQRLLSPQFRLHAYDISGGGKCSFKMSENDEMQVETRKYMHPCPVFISCIHAHSVYWVTILFPKKVVVSDMDVSPFFICGLLNFIMLFIMNKCKCK